MKQVLLACMLGVVLSSNSGCILFGPCGDCGPCGPLVGGCGEACGEGCGECCDSPCADPCDDQCGGNGCQPCYPHGPLSWVVALFTVNTWCDKGCGELYCGDWYADACEPCDQCGRYVGGCRRCGKGSVSAGPALSARAHAVDEGVPSSDCPHCNRVSDARAHSHVAPDTSDDGYYGPSVKEYAQRKAMVTRSKQPRSSSYASHSMPSQRKRESHSPNRGPRLIAQTDRAVKPATVKASREVVVEQSEADRNAVQQASDETED